MRVYWREPGAGDLPKAIGGVFLDIGADEASVISDGCLRFEHRGIVWTVPLGVVAAIQGAETDLSELEQLARLRLSTRDTPEG